LQFIAAVPSAAIERCGNTLKCTQAALGLVTTCTPSFARRLRSQYARMEVPMSFFRELTTSTA
jgi:hypothetical protein